MPPPTPSEVERLVRQMDSIKGRTKRRVLAVLSRTDLTPEQKARRLYPLLDGSREAAWVLVATWLREVDDQVDVIVIPPALPYLGIRWWDELNRSSLREAAGMVDDAITDAGHSGATDSVRYSLPEGLQRDPGAVRWQMRPSGITCGLCVARAGRTQKSRPRPTHSRCDCVPIPILAGTDRDAYLDPWKKAYDDIARRPKPPKSKAKEASRLSHEYATV